ncbi:hypothetical protein BN874_2850003 [Candidatus Contendobacter odensis Run_B_J11]|uniref:Uncharacterized protein n=1 Tax=Candidatus Contendobacter odensis Run_B_J11 TaxID=1400861 RepID=A0A7U7GCR1_9GAMM|nr:hypothetical protein BN874_2850003 [Candidatus Contendobacter odensis Run_B_J11]
MLQTFDKRTLLRKVWLWLLLFSGLEGGKIGESSSSKTGKLRVGTLIEMKDGLTRE